MAYLTCPTCRFTVSAAAARSPLQECPRCKVRGRARVAMVVMTDPPRRFSRQTDALDRIAEANARLRPPARGGRWA